MTEVMNQSFRNDTENYFSIQANQHLKPDMTALRDHQEEVVITTDADVEAEFDSQTQQQQLNTKAL